MTTAPVDPGSDSGAPLENRGPVIGWAAAGTAVFVALVIAGWGISSLAADRDVLPSGLPLWTGPVAVAASALVVFALSLRAVRERWASGVPGFNLAHSLTAGVGAVLTQGAVITIFAAFGGDAPSVGSALLGVGLAQVVSVFGIVAALAGAVSVVVLEGLAGRYPPGREDA